MPVTTAADHWDGIYESKPASALSWYQETPTTSLRLIAAAELDGDDTIIDVGAGASALVDELVAQGYTAVVVADISQAALALTRQRLADSVEYVVGDVLDLDLPSGSMWHDRAVFHFLTDSTARHRYKSVMARHVVTGGHAVVATFAEDGGEMCSGLPVSRYSSDALAEAFAPQFSLVESCREEHVTPGGSTQPFTYVLLRRGAQP